MDYSLFKSYLSNMKQYVKFEEELPQVQEIKTGVQQVSFLENCNNLFKIHYLCI